MRNYFLIGQVMGAKATTRKDKVTGQVIANTEVIVQYMDHDKNGELILDTDTVQFPADQLQTFKDNIQKFIVIPYIFLAVRSGTYMLVNEDVDYHFFDTNPLIPKQEIKKAS